MNIKQIEDATIAALKAESFKDSSPLKIMQIERCPEDMKLRLMSSAVGAIWVHFSGLGSSKPKNIGGSMQDDSYSFDINILTRSLRDSQDSDLDSGSAYSVMPKIREVLTGLAPVLGFTQMWLKTAKLIGVVDGVWQYGMRFQTDGKYFYEKTDPVYADSTQIEFESPDRTVTIPPVEEE